MSLTVVTPPKTTALTTLQHVKDELRITSVNASRDAWLEARIEDASQAIQDELDRPLTRQRVRQRLSGSGRMLTVVDLTPVAQLDSVTNWRLGAADLSLTALGTEVIRIDNAEAGLIWRDGGWPDDSPVQIGLTVESLPQSGQQPWEVQYLGGWLTRADDFAASGVTASGTDLMLPNDADDTMPYVAPGDQIRLRGWANNRGRYVVTARSDYRISVDGLFQLEVGGISAAVDVHNLPSLLERACLDAVRSWYYSQTSDPTVKSESIGDWSVSYGGSGGTGDRSHVLPGMVLTGLDRYRRLM